MGAQTSSQRRMSSRNGSEGRNSEDTSTFDAGNGTQSRDKRRVLPALDPFGIRKHPRKSTDRTNKTLSSPGSTTTTLTEAAPPTQPPIAAKKADYGNAVTVNGGVPAEGAGMVSA